MKTVILILCMALAGCGEDRSGPEDRIEQWVGAMVIHRATGSVDTTWMFKVRVNGNMTYSFGAYQTQREAENALLRRIPFTDQQSRIDRLAADSARMVHWASPGVIAAARLDSCYARVDRLAADSALSKKIDWAITLEGDTIWYSGALDSIHSANPEVEIQRRCCGKNVELLDRVFRLRDDSARCAEIRSVGDTISTGWIDSLDREER